jgi:hypothetical protein
MSRAFFWIGIFIVIISMVSCKSGYTKIGSKNANYIPYYLKVYEADSLFIVGEYQKSYEILDDLFKKYEPIEIQGYYEYSNYIMAAVLSNNTKNLKKKAKLGYIYNGGINSQQIEVLKKLDSIESIIGFTSDERKKFLATYDKNMNQTLRRSVDSIYTADQSIQGVHFKDIEEIAKMSDFHEIKIRKIFNMYGYPSTKKIGYGEILMPVFMHANLEFLENYLVPRLLTYVKQGYESPLVYANTYDKLYLHYNNNYYYSDFKIEKVNQKIDSARASIGLPYKGYSAWRVKKIYDEYAKHQNK